MLCLLFLFLSIVSCQARMNKADIIPIAFSKAGYRPRLMVPYVTRTEPWKQGRRKVLDWGCGAGELAKVLANEGADQVVAVDKHPSAAKVAKRILKNVPNARFSSGKRWWWIPGIRGDLGYRNAFDIVISFGGGLQYGVPLKNNQGQGERLFYAMKQAVRACRPQGVVVESIIQTSPEYGVTIGLVLAGLVGRFGKKWKWLWNRPTWSQVCFWQMLVFPLCGNPLAGPMMHEVAHTFKERKWRWTSIAIGCWNGLTSWKLLVRHNKLVVVKRYILTVVGGLENVKVYRRLCFRPFSIIPNKDSDNTGCASFLQNMLQPVRTIFVFVGTKKDD